MKQLLNTLFVTTQGSYLSRKGETVLVSQDHETKLRVPIHNLGSIVCFGNVSCSPFLMGLCGERNVTLSFLTENGRFLARVTGPVSGNVLLRREQYRRADDLQASALIANCRVVLQRALRDRPELQQSDLPHAATDLQQSLQDLREQADLDSIRGMEGMTANTYFSVFGGFNSQVQQMSGR